MRAKGNSLLFFVDFTYFSSENGGNHVDFYWVTKRTNVAKYLVNVNEMTGKNWDIWAKYHLEKRNKKAYNNSRKSAETKDETVFMDI